MIIWDIFGYLNLEWIPFFDGNTSISVFLPVTMVLRCGRRKHFLIPPLNECYILGIGAIGLSHIGIGEKSGG